MTPERGFTVAKYARSFKAFALATVDVARLLAFGCRKTAISKNNHLHIPALLNLTNDCSAAAENFIVRMWCKHE